MPLLNKLFGSSLDSMQSALNLRMEKQGVIQSNIANIETPGYKRQGLSFADVMRTAGQSSGRLAATDPKHFGLGSMKSDVNSFITSENRPVDLDEEMMELSENQLMYQVTARIIAKKLEGLKIAIEEGGK